MRSQLGKAALVAASAALGVLAFPPFGWSGLALVAWVPGLAALRGERVGRALVWGFAHGVLLFGGTLIWLFGIFGAAALPMIGVLAAFPACFACLHAGIAAHGFSVGARTALAMLSWIGLEHLRSEWFALPFPWITPGTALPPCALTPWIGAYGISGLVIAGAALLVERSWSARASGCALLVALGALAALPPEAERPALAERRRVALVQGEGLGLERLLALSRSLREPVDAIVWPELALAFDPRAFPRVEEALQALLADTGAALLVVGCRARDEAGDPQNAALLLGRDGWIGRHVKQRLVPFVDTGRASGVVVAHATPIGRIATPICFDLDASALAAEAVADGAELLLAPSLDPAAWGDVQRWQHAELARHRAAELGRWVAVASGAGRTQVLDPRGARRAQLPLDGPGVLVAEVGISRERTPFSRFGRWLGPFCTFVAATLAAWLLLASAKRRSRV